MGPPAKMFEHPWSKHLPQLMLALFTTQKCVHLSMKFLTRGIKGQMSSSLHLFHLPSPNCLKPNDRIYLSEPDSYMLPFQEYIIVQCQSQDLRQSFTRKITERTEKHFHQKHGYH